MKKKIGDLILIFIIVAISTATAWSLYSSHSSTKQRLPSAPKVIEQPGDFFKQTYQERLKEEGNRTSRVEKLIKEGRLSDKPARHFKVIKEQKSGH